MPGSLLRCPRCQVPPQSFGCFTPTRLVVEPAGASVLCVGGVRSGAGADHDVARHLRYHWTQQPLAPQPSSAASLSVLLATSGAARTP